SENPRTDPGKALLSDSVVDSRLSIVMAVHLAPHARVEEPLHQLRTSDAERILEILVQPGAVAVNGNRKALDAEFRHFIPRFCSLSRRFSFPEARSATRLAQRRRLSTLRSGGSHRSESAS